ncbi:hypothetical protein [Paenibacillus sp. LjRoot56]|uniref:hypothetical protein n=1 Tax=Paenibacillus sp. LjRoot56 TaxID=3342333 RepID=UPI003ECE51AF
MFIGNRVNGVGMGIEEIIQQEISDWKREPLRNLMLIGEQYYGLDHDVLKHKRMTIGEGGIPIEAIHLDGSVFLVSEAQAGLNCALFHARSRTVDIPHFEDNVKERAARNSQGKTYDLPGDMTYKDWESKHVEPTVSLPKMP